MFPLVFPWGHSKTCSWVKWKVDRTADSTLNMNFQSRDKSRTTVSESTALHVNGLVTCVTGVEQFKSSPEYVCISMANIPTGELSLKMIDGVRDKIS